MPRRGQACWVLQPTRSLGWPAMRRFIVIVTLLLVCLGGAFFLLGLPMILVYCVVQAAAFAAAFLAVAHAGLERQVIRVEDDDVVVESGRRRPETVWRCRRGWARVALEPSRYRLHPARLVLSAGGRRVELGAFLSEPERRALLDELRGRLGAPRAVSDAVAEGGRREPC